MMRTLASTRKQRNATLVPQPLIYTPSSISCSLTSCKQWKVGGWLWILLMKGGGLVVNTANERWGVGYEYCQDVRGWNEGTEIQSCNAINDLKVVHTVVFCCCFVVFFCFFSHWHLATILRSFPWTSCRPTTRRLSPRDSCRPSMTSTWRTRDSTTCCLANWGRSSLRRKSL